MDEDDREQKARAAILQVLWMNGVNYDDAVKIVSDFQHAGILYTMRWESS